MAHNTTHNRGLGWISNSIYIEYAEFGADHSMKLALQAMVIGGRCKGGGELMLKEDLAI